MSIEKIDCCGDDTAARIILNAMATFIEDDVFKEKFSNNGRMVDVELLVNGVSVPVVQTLVDAWKRSEAVLEERAKKKALEMVTASGLEPLAKALQDAEWTIREKLKIFDEY